MSGDIGTTDDASDNCYHVVTATSVNNQTELDGFTIRDGTADQSAPHSSGAGIYITGSASSPQIFNCVIRENRAKRSTGQFGAGGGVFSQSVGANLSFTNCVFDDNVAGYTGGACHITSADSIEFTDCRFTDNSTIGSPPTEPTSTIGGGHLYLSGSEAQEAKFTDCLIQGGSTTMGSGGGVFSTGMKFTARQCDFVGNTTNGGAYAEGSGGGLYLLNTDTAEIVSCNFVSNTANQDGYYAGGGAAFVGTIHGGFAAKVVNCKFLGNFSADGGYGGGLVHFKTGLTCTNSLFAGNRANQGAGAYCHDFDMSFTNCTFAHNAADLGTDNDRKHGGIALAGPHSAVLRNCILWQNTDASTATGVSEEQIGPQGSASPDIAYSCIQGGFTGTGSNNISADPMFVGPTTGDVTSRNYRLEPCSPASDSAADDNVPADAYDVDNDTDEDEPTPDLDQAARITDNPLRDGNAVDMGAYETVVVVCGTIGDVNGDTEVDALDIQCFLECLFGWEWSDASEACEGKNCACADFDIDGLASTSDIECFVNLLVAGESCGIVDCDIGQRSFPDCNENGTHDANDIGDGTSEDCNANGVPDECEIDENSSAPGGPFFCTQNCLADIDESGVPDECEPDCNTNGTPDAMDISESTSNDVNNNGIPDECELDCNTNGTPDAWDLSEETSPDCNTNGIPDECEPDCNTNGVPDDCDIDPSDPDGDEWVSPDCNGNEYPDECDLALPPGFGSLDCNDNDTPDECDIAECESDPACDDCNENGIPDACDIAAEISEDADTDGIPDECEEESLMGAGGGESMMGGGEGSEDGGGETTGETQMPPGDEEAAWEAFFEWSMAQCWGSDCETSGAEQFAAMVAKMRELGLTVGDCAP